MNAFLLRAQELLEYKADDGVFLWKHSRGRVKAGALAGRDHSHGYLRIGIDGTDYFVHRLVWLFETGGWPTKEIDHIDGNKKNNKKNNLRDVSRQTNALSFMSAHTNKTGCAGVHYRKQNKMFVAKAFVCGKTKHLGSFRTAEIAGQAYANFKKQIKKEMLLDGD